MKVFSSGIANNDGFSSWVYKEKGKKANFYIKTDNSSTAGIYVDGTNK